MKRELVEQVLQEARSAEAKLAVSDRRDTFTLEADEVASAEVGDDHIKIQMEDGKASVYVDFDSIYKLVVEKERSGKSSSRAGFGAARS